MVKKPMTALVAAVLACCGAATDVSVQYDAVYSIPSTRGPLCSGDGVMPSGTACPLKGDIASAGCSPGQLSYTDAGCVASVDAECAIVSGTSWGCVFPHERSSSSLSSASGSGYEAAEVEFPAGEQGHDDEVTFPPPQEYDQSSATQGATKYTPSKDRTTNGATTTSSAQQGGNGEAAYAWVLQPMDTESTTGTPSPAPCLRSESGSAAGRTGGFYTQSPNQQGGKTIKQGLHQSQIVQSGGTGNYNNYKSSYRASQAGNAVDNGVTTDSYQSQTTQSIKAAESSSYKSSYDYQSSLSGDASSRSSYQAGQNGNNFDKKKSQQYQGYGHYSTHDAYPPKSGEGSVSDDSRVSHDAYPSKPGKGGRI